MTSAKNAGALNDIERKRNVYFGFLVVWTVTCSYHRICFALTKYCSVPAYCGPILEGLHQLIKTFFNTFHRQSFILHAVSLKLPDISTNLTFPESLDNNLTNLTSKSAIQHDLSTLHPNK